VAGVAETAASPRPPEKAAAGGRWRIPFPPLLQSLACAVCGGASSVHRARARECLVAAAVGEGKNAGKDSFWAGLAGTLGLF